MFLSVIISLTTQLCVILYNPNIISKNQNISNANFKVPASNSVGKKDDNVVIVFVLETNLTKHNEEVVQKYNCILQWEVSLLVLLVCSYDARLKKDSLKTYVQYVQFKTELYI